MLARLQQLIAVTLLALTIAAAAIGVTMTALGVYAAKTVRGVLVRR